MSEPQLKCGNPWGVIDDCPVGLDGHDCTRPDRHEGRCRCRCGATTTYRDPIFEDDEELQEARELLNGW